MAISVELPTPTYVHNHTYNHTHIHTHTLNHIHNQTHTHIHTHTHSHTYTKYTILLIPETLIDFVVPKTWHCGLELTLDVKLCEA